MKKKVHHESLVVVDAYDGHGIEGPRRQVLLDEFKRTGSMLGAHFDYEGAPHEDEEDPSTWGPASPEDVDWTGFETPA